MMAGIVFMSIEMPVMDGTQSLVKAVVSCNFVIGFSSCGGNNYVKGM